MNNHNPLVSIIIPTFNRAELITETLASVQNQSYQNWECIVADDFSTDHSMTIVDSYTNNDNRFITVKNKKRKGAPGARNTAIEVSKGAFLVFLDSDDLLAADCISNRINEFLKHPDCNFLVFSTIEFKKTIYDTNLLFNVNTTDKVIERFLNLDVPWITMAAIWKRNSLLQMGPWNENILSWQDWDLHIRALLKGYKYIYFSKVDNYLRRDNNIETIGKNSISKAHLESHLQLFESLRPLMKDRPEYMFRLYGIAYWIGEKALTQGYTHIAKKAIRLSHENLNILKKIINLGGVILFKKFYIKYPKVPDFGTVRKVYA